MVQAGEPSLPPLGCALANIFLVPPSGFCKLPFPLSPSSRRAPRSLVGQFSSAHRALWQRGQPLGHPLPSRNLGQTLLFIFPPGDGTIAAPNGGGGTARKQERDARDISRLFHPPWESFFR